MIVVSDTSPISNLLLIGRIELLRHLYNWVVIPAAVASELQAIPGHRRDLEVLEWIETVALNDRGLYSTLIEDLDEGEAEAIGLSVQLKADVLLIDELYGRHVAREPGIEIIGLAGVLVQAKKAGLIDLVKPEIDKLVSEAGFWMSPKLIAEVLGSVGET